MGLVFKQNETLLFFRFMIGRYSKPMIVASDKIKKKAMKVVSNLSGMNFDFNLSLVS